jgi:hypothetical protein
MFGLFQWQTPNSCSAYTCLHAFMHTLACLSVFVGILTFQWCLSAVHEVLGLISLIAIAGIHLCLEGKIPDISDQWQFALHETTA